LSDKKYNQYGTEKKGTVFGRIIVGQRSDKISAEDIGNIFYHIKGGKGGGTIF